MQARAGTCLPPSCCKTSSASLHGYMPALAPVRVRVSTFRFHPSYQEVVVSSHSPRTTTASQWPSRLVVFSARGATSSPSLPPSSSTFFPPNLSRGRLSSSLRLPPRLGQLATPSFPSCHGAFSSRRARCVALARAPPEPLNHRGSRRGWPRSQVPSLYLDVDLNLATAPLPRAVPPRHSSLLLSITAGVGASPLCKPSPSSPCTAASRGSFPPSEATSRAVGALALDLLMGSL